MKKYCLIFLFIWLIIIFLLSAMPSSESGKQSKLLLKDTINIVNKISNNKLSSLDNNVINKLHKPFRKLMHIFVYFILSILFLISLKNSKYNIYIITIILCIIYAISDEYHQSMVVGRCARLLDVYIDSIGVLFGCFIYYLYTNIKSLLKY